MITLSLRDVYICSSAILRYFGGGGPVTTPFGDEMVKIVMVERVAGETVPVRKVEKHGYIYNSYYLIL